MSWSRGQDQFGLLNNGTLVRLAQGEGLGLIVVREDDDRQERENWQHVSKPAHLSLLISSS